MAEFTAPNQKGKPGYEGYLNDRVVPVSALLKDAGYNTYMAGKWHMGEEPEHWPAARGFMRDLTLIPGGGSHFDDMWGAKGERQLYTQNGKASRRFVPAFIPARIIRRPSSATSKRTAQTESRSLPISRCKLRTIRSNCQLNGSTDTRAVTIRAMM